MVRIARPGSKIENSMAHVFICIMTKDGALPGAPTMEMWGKVNEIFDAVGYKKRPGKLWVYPTRMKWPAGLAKTPNGKDSRVVWCAIVPQQRAEEDKDIDASLELLASCIKATGMQMKIAAYNDGGFFECTSYNRQANKYNEKLNKYLGEWDVEVFYPSFK